MPQEGVKSAAAVASVDEGGLRVAPLRGPGGPSVTDNALNSLQELKDPTHLSAQLPARGPAQSTGKTTPSLYYQNNPHLSLASQLLPHASNLPADKVFVKLPCRPSFTSEPKGGVVRVCPQYVCARCPGGTGWAGHQPCPKLPSGWHQGQDLQTLGACAGPSGRERELRAGSAGVVSSPPPSSPCLPAHLGSVITHSGCGHPGSPLMDVSREVVGPREEQDVGGEGLVTAPLPALPGPSGSQGGPPPLLAKHLRST